MTPMTKALRALTFALIEFLGGMAVVQLSERLFDGKMIHEGCSPAVTKSRHLR